MWARVRKANSAEKGSSAAPRRRETSGRTGLRAANEIEERAVIGINKETDEAFPFPRENTRISLSDPALDRRFETRSRRQG
jgi:hypothetical protein